MINKFLYISGFLIVIGNIFYKPYRNKYMLKELAIIKARSKAQVKYLTEETKVLLEKEQDINDYICDLNDYKDTEYLTNYQIDSIDNHIKKLNDFLSRAYSILENDAKRFSKDRYELVGGYYYKRNVNKISYYGFFTLGMFLLICGSERAIKDSGNDKQSNEKNI